MAVNFDIQPPAAICPDTHLSIPLLAKFSDPSVQPCENLEVRLTLCDDKGNPRNNGDLIVRSIPRGEKFGYALFKINPIGTPGSYKFRLSLCFHGRSSKSKIQDVVYSSILRVYQGAPRHEPKVEAVRLLLNLKERINGVSQEDIAQWEEIWQAIQPTTCLP
ncbi:hypothetical protein AJ80_09357 [Polytolypa hystricis UAMH7299]|uniref:Uncharacterized protein n=1 Tax=Polytolypa hystricis (strain UAMH7299) TaxID=1447883 RepID=A0A2B7WJ91_POLH7|nr:hypothetical protein AJ80_09357 [Polytolypa hystricis UAMH7299]